MKIPGYELLEQVGEGSMAVVWRAHQKSLDRDVAIKVLKPELSRDMDEVRDFVREARAAAAIKHPNVIQVIDIAQHESTFYIVMEMIHGPSVGELIKQRGRFPQKRALHVALPVARALAQAWESKNIIHRDIKPHNILIDEDGTVKLSDLGLAKMVSANMPTQDDSELTVGTPNYISPEQARGDTGIDCRTDMYGLGASIYHMITGRLPFGDLETVEALKSQIEGHLPNPRDLAPDISPGLVQLITRLMMKNPSDRYKDWHRAVRAIERVATGHLLIHKHADPEKSTISPPATPRHQPQPRASSSLPRTKTKRKKKGLPISVHAAFWVIIILLWAAIAYNRTKLPPFRFFPAKKKPQPTRIDKRSPSDRSGSSSLADSTKDTSAKVALNRPDSSIDKDTADPTGTEVTYALYDAVQGAVQAMYKEDFDAAALAIASELAKPHPQPVLDALNELSVLVPEIAEVPNCIENEFMRLTGTDVTIRHNGQSRTVLVRSVAAGKIRGMIDTPEGKRVPVTFTISQLNASERARWMGETDSTAKAVLQFVLFMKDREYSSAGKVAAHCGPLSEIFRMEINAKTGNSG